jgi:GNAT superfamily N-acetyltransferase
VFGPGPVWPEAVDAALTPWRDSLEVFVDASVDAMRRDALDACQRAGLVLADTNLRLVRDGGRIEGRPDRAPVVRPAPPADPGAVEAIAAAAFRLSRFHRDPLLSPDRADALKAAWAGNYFAGVRGDGMVVVEAGEAVAGFLLYILAEATLIIDLIAVAEGRQSAGLGRALVAGAAQAAGAGRLATGTQAVNVRAVRFYEDLGFRLVGASQTFHFHGTGYAHRKS